WRFNNETGENNTYFRDWSSYENNGICTNCPNYTTGKFGNGAVFDGVDDFVDMGIDSDFDLKSTFTIEAWFKRDDSTSAGDQFIINRFSTGGWALLIPPSNQIQWSLFAVANMYSISTITDTSTWHQVVLTRNSGVVSIYLDGLFDKSQGFSTASGSGLNLYIGRRISAAGYFNGTIDEVKIWNRVLSPEEINASYNAGLYRLETNFTNLSDGTHTYTAYAQDLAGNINQTETRILTIDTTPPLITIDSPLNNSYNTSTIWFNTTSTDTNNISWCGYTLDHITRPKWSTNWKYSKEITINNTGNSDNLTDHQVLVNLTASNFNFSKANSDGNDTRFTWLNQTSNQEQNMSFWIESWDSGSETALIWVKVPYIAPNENGQVYMYYGNTNTRGVSNGTNTFMAFNAGNTVSGMTALTNGGTITWDTTGTEISATATGSENVGYLYFDTMLPSSFVIEGYMRHASGLINSQVGFKHGATQENADSNRAMYNNGNSLFYLVNDSSSYNTTGTGDYVGIATNALFSLRIANSGNKELIVDGTSKVTQSNDIINAYAGLYIYTNVAGVNYYSNIRVRKYAPTEPTVLSVGSEIPLGISKGNAYAINANATHAFALINNKTLSTTITPGWNH
ncbi:MAG: DUF2341 domain-containing protein, partial [Candidatus Aenigmarchaeota archaeon]|nr:DUF2341 domain-containing protein [Candidatus Aenigmarchaeota archaeon]